MARNLSTLSALIFPVALVACSAGGGTSTGDSSTGGSGGETASTGGQGSGAGTASSMGGSTGEFMGTGGGSTTGCVSGPDEDKDMDGYSVNAGDCNDCDPNVSPGSIEVVPPLNAPNCVADGGTCMAGSECCNATCDPTTNTCVAYVAADEDCDGTADNPPQPCDTNLALDSSDPMDGARAIDLCKQADPNNANDWGVVAAQYVRANGTPTSANLQVGIEPGWGPNVSPQLGSRMLVLSSGHARTSSDPGSCGSLSCSVNGGGTAPAGFPQDVPGCSGGTDINDDVGLDLTLRAPKNATGYKFNFDFYSFEYPEWVCTTFNDQFIALVNPPPMGSINGNVSFDSQGNPVSVNIAFFNVCSGCALGTGELQGTGFDVWNDAGATSWLQTTAPITGGETFNIRYAIWDTGDTAWDSTALIDSFEWIANGGTVTVGTTPEIPQ